MQAVRLRSQVLPAPDGTEIHVWQAGDPTAKRILLLVHGYGEYGGRYAGVLQPFLDRGFRVVLPDVRGHGLSGGPRGYVRRYNTYHDDLCAVISHLDLDLSETAMLGHSHGGLITASAIARRRVRPRLAALTSPLMGVGVRAPAWKVAMGRAMSKAIPRLSLPGEITPELLTHDQTIVDHYLKDPLIHHVVNARWFTEMEAEVEATFRAAASLRVPMLVLQAGDDRIVSPEASRRFAATVAAALYEEVPDAYHELLFEVDGARHATRIATWFHDTWGDS